MSEKKRKRILDQQREANYVLPFYITNPIQSTTPQYDPFDRSSNTTSILNDRASLLGDEEKINSSRRKFRRNMN